MSKFLKEISNWLLDNYSNETENVTVVFPNRRAGLFFQKYISESIDKPTFSPSIVTISELISKISGYRLADQNALVIELFKVFQSVTNSKESLDDFFYWGEMMLSDFNDIDKYMIDARQLFSNIKSLKEIDAGFDYLTPEQQAYIAAFWENILRSKTSVDKEHFLTIWDNLFAIYTQFNEKLHSLGVAYEGMMYRKMAENLLEQQEVQSTDKFMIIGFNALNLCETKLFSFLKVNTQTCFFWDYDEYYLKNELHEASMFLRSNLSLFPMPADFNVSFDHFSALKQIDVVAVPGFSGQATMAAHWLSSNSDCVTSKFDNTALVLCDENLLMPMLNSIPDSIGELNITMGYPVKSSPAFALIKSLIDIDRNARKNKDGETIFYFRNVLALLNNSLLKMKYHNEVDRLTAEIHKENKIYLKVSDFRDPFISFIFTLPLEALQCKSYLQKILIQTFHDTTEEDKLLKETLYQLHLALNRMNDAIFSLNGHSEVELSKRLYYQLLTRQLEKLTIPFEGEPLSGMQLMGFLETRCLDFDNIILLSFNDDRLPGKPHQHSFIPYSLRKGFGLPVIEQRNAMYSYYFYRLIQRAKKVTLVYDSRTEGLCSGEMSRFVTQMMFEAKHLTINEQQAKFNFEPSQNIEIVIQKDEKLLDKLENYLGKTRISPSALNIYIDCKLKFYFRYLEKIGQPDEVVEEIDHLIFGRVAHVALEELYKPFIGKEVSKEDIQQLIKDKKAIEMSLRNALQKEYFKKGDFDLNGRNLLVFDIIRKYVVRILIYDASIAPFELIGLEQEFESETEISGRTQPITVRFGGTVDRIDRVGDTIRIVDYKTGKAEDSVRAISKLFEQHASRNKAAFQTMMYAGCVHQKMNTNLPIMPAIYGARSVFTPNFDPEFTFQGGKLMYQPNAEEFQFHLKALLQELVGPEVPFTQTPIAQLCANCEYNALCNR